MAGLVLRGASCRHADPLEVADSHSAKTLFVLQDKEHKGLYVVEAAQRKVQLRLTSPSMLAVNQPCRLGQ